MPSPDRHSDRQKLLEAHFLFGALSASDRDSLLAYSRIETYRNNDVIFRKGDPGRGMMGVLGGEVRIVVPSVDGREIVVNVIRKGEIVGEIALLDGKDRSATAVAVGDCTLLAIDRRDFLPFVESRSGLALRLIAILCQRLRRTTQQVEDVLFLDAPARVAKQLLELAAAGATPTPAGLRIEARLSQRELGQRIGLSRESVNKQLGEWQQLGVLTIENRLITLCDEGFLKRLV